MRMVRFWDVLHWGWYMSWILIAEVALTTLEFGLQMGVTKVIFEEDFFRVINKLCNQEADLSVIGAIIADIKTKCLAFSSCVFQHVKRGGNATAYELAKYGAGVVNMNIWAEECPVFLLHIVSKDVNSL
ncbi:hypothetical protein PTKIN_Ptkin05aG0068300 [Pterospermum kingtungense]